MGQLSAKFPDLRFGAEDLIFSDQEYRALAGEFWPNARLTGSLLPIDRAFIQAALFVAVAKSEQAGFFFDLYRSFFASAPSRSMTSLLRKLATSVLRRRYKAYIDESPAFSAIGKAAIQYSGFGTAWRARCLHSDPSFLDDFRRVQRD